MLPIQLLKLIGCLLILSGWSLTATAKQPSLGYNQCLKNAMIDRVSSLPESEAHVLCQKKSPVIELEKTELPKRAIQKLKINAGFGWGIFNGSIYNGNSNYTVTQLSFSMTPVHDHHMALSATASHETKEYSVDLELPPLSKGALSVVLNTDDASAHDFEWSVIKALGYKTH